MKAKKSKDDNWVVFNEEFDFSEYASEENRGQEHKFMFKFQKVMAAPEFKDAFISAKIHIVDFNKDDAE